MKLNHKIPIVLAVFVLVVASLACSGGASTQAPTSAPIPPTDTPKPVPTTPPTSTPEPLPTPDVAATKKADEFLTALKTFQDKGYAQQAEGKITELEPFKEEWAQIGWYQWWPYDNVVSDFVFKGHFKWSTASNTPEISGCGVIFGLQDNKDHYAVFLDRSRILFLMSRGSNVYNVGKTRGSGRASFGNPAEADFSISVKGQSAYVAVNSDITEYTLSMDQTTEGNFALTLLSGTNKDYGTRCEMTDLVFWTPK